MANRRKVDRADQARKALTRASSFSLRAARIGGALLVLGGLVLGARSVHAWAVSSPRFAIATVEVKGAVRSGGDVRGLLGIAEGDNLFQADVDAARAALLGHPWIRAATVERSFPQGLRVMVLEREAVALVVLQHLYLLDEEGEIFKRARPGDPQDLPLITGLSREAWGEGGAAEELSGRERLKEALAVLNEYQGRELARSLPVAEVHLDAVDGLTLYLGDAGTAVKLGRDRIAEKLTRLETIKAELSRRGQRAEVLRLDNRARPGWVAARLAVVARAPGGKKARSASP